VKKGGVGEGGIDRGVDRKVDGRAGGRVDGGVEVRCTGRSYVFQIWSSLKYSWTTESIQ